MSAGLTGKALIEPSEAPALRVQFLVEGDALPSHLVDGFGANGLRKLRVPVPIRRMLSRTAVSMACGRNRLSLAILPSLLLGVVADVIAIPLRLAHRVGVHHRGTAWNAEEEPPQKRTQLVPDGRALVAAIAPKRFVDPIPRFLIYDPVVFTRIQDAFVVNHPGVQDVGQGCVQRASSEWLPAPNLAVFCGPPLTHQTDPLGFLEGPAASIPSPCTGQKEFGPAPPLQG